MIKKSLVLLCTFSFLAYANGVVTLNKDAGKCTIIQKSGIKKDCSKKASYALHTEDKVESSKVKREDFSYNQTKSFRKPVFVLPIDKGYMIETSFLSYIGFVWNNYVNPNKSGSEGGTLGAKVAISSLPSYSKVYFGANINLELNNNEKGVQYTLETDSEKVIFLPKTYKGLISIDTKKLLKNEKYVLDIWSKNNNQTVSFEFLQGREEQIYKQYLGLSKNDRSKYREALFNELDLKLK